MQCSPTEPTLADVLSDGVVRAMMTADHVNAAKLEALLQQVAGKLAQDRLLKRSPA